MTNEQDSVKFPTRLPATELRIGDIIETSDTPGYNTATVYHVDDANVYVVRPYVHTSDFVTTGGVITYLGEEKFSIPRSTFYTYTLVERRDPEYYRNLKNQIKDSITYALDHGEYWRVKELLRSL